jgi:hypothetical protein
MGAESPVFGACAFIAGLIGFTMLQAAQRRRASREASAVAQALMDFAARIRRESRCQPLDEDLLVRARRLGTPELVTFELAQELARPDPALLADTAQRLALRLKRRVAFERKMLARTAPGRRRGALAAGLPGVVILALAFTGESLPLFALAALMALEAGGCWLLWKVARIEV